METETPFKDGYLLFPPQGVLGQLKKSWHKKYCQLFKSSKHGIERLEVFESEDDLWKTSTVRIITLENCIKITQEPQKHPNVFTIVTKSNSHHLATQTERELEEWITAIQSIAFKDNVSKQTIEEDNDLYCSSADGIFTVRLVPSEASTRCNLEAGVYTLVITSTAIQLRDNNDHHLLFTWPYRYIRRYGYREGKFTFEAGRKCETGEGTFHLEHSNQQEIFRCLSTKMKSMRKMLSGADTPVSMSAIVCGDNQFQAALSMEARSRSPLPPSPTSATALDLDFSAISSAKLPVMDAKAPIVSSAVSKPKPVKPPRKSLFVSNIMKGGEDLAGDAYDKVEVRRDAWRTMGVDNISHSERPYHESDVEEDGLESILKQASNRQPSTDDLSIRSQGSKILVTQLSHRSDATSENYDTLQHFGSTSKLNANPGYRQLPAHSGVTSTTSTPAPPVDLQPPAPPSFNEYDSVSNSMQAFRLADDSHYGYGVIRKKSTQSEGETAGDAGPNHKVYNQLEYAIVQKPKGV